MCLRAGVQNVKYRFPTDHKDVIHDMAYDYYGKRLATCSSDQYIKIWDQDTNGQWHLTSQVKAHKATIYRLSWAHPEFGQVLASCSYDRTVCVFEEHERRKTDGEVVTSLEKQSSLVDFKDAVYDVQFAPHHLGLMLAACTATGQVVVYDSGGAMTLAQAKCETLQAENTSASTCLSWSAHRFDRVMLAEGSADGSIRLWVQDEARRKWAVVSRLSGHTGSVHDVSWAATMGRPYHLLASASKDGTVRIWKVTTREHGRKKQQQLAASGGSAAADGGALEQPETDMIAVFDDHQSEVWRARWNVTGTVLATSGNCGNVRLWKANYLGVWRPIAVFGEEQGQTVGDF